MVYNGIYIGTIGKRNVCSFISLLSIIPFTTIPGLFFRQNQPFSLQNALPEPILHSPDAECSFSHSPDAGCFSHSCQQAADCEGPVQKHCHRCAAASASIHQCAWLPPAR